MKRSYRSPSADPWRSAILLLCGSMFASAGCAGDTSPGRAPVLSAGRSGGNVPADGGADLGDGFGNRDARVPLPTVGDGGRPDGGLSSGDDPDSPNCGSIELEPMVNTVIEPGNLIVVFDNSGSMSAPWDGTPRWLAAGNALRDAVSSLAEYVTVAAIVFPTDSSCAVASLDSGNQINFLPGGAFVATWDNFLLRNTPTGGTPLGGALQAADAALRSNTRPGRTHVVVLTDGAPNCDTAPLSSLPPAWFAQGTPTHVVGLPGSESAVTVLDNLARAGGTTSHLTPRDARMLRRQLANIVSESVTSALPSCTIPLDPPAPNPDDVHLVVTQGGTRQNADRDLDDGGGWRISEDGSQIELFGAFCDQGLAGAYQRISIEYGCVDLPPLDPPRGPD
jgi:hypothetical protein